jgi:hypothetical protein
VKLDIGFPDGGVVELVVQGTMHDDDGEVLAFALEAIPARYAIVVDLRHVTCCDESSGRVLRSALAQFRDRVPPVLVRPGPAWWPGIGAREATSDTVDVTRVP